MSLRASDRPVPIAVQPDSPFLRAGAAGDVLIPALDAGNGIKGVQHFCIETNALGDAGIAYDLVQEPKVPVWLALGRRRLDTLISFYVRSDRGFDIEVAARGERPGDDFVQRDRWNSEPRGHQRLTPGWAPTELKIEG